MSDYIMKVREKVGNKLDQTHARGRKFHAQEGEYQKKK